MSHVRFLRKQISTINYISVVFTLLSNQKRLFAMHQLSSASLDFIIALYGDQYDKKEPKFEWDISSVGIYQSQIIMFI